MADPLKFTMREANDDADPEELISWECSRCLDSAIVLDVYQHAKIAHRVRGGRFAVNTSFSHRAKSPDVVLKSAKE
jgi:hypothetical protein